MAVARMETCEDVGELARELGVRPRCLYKWRRKLEMVEPGQEASRPSTHASAHRKEIHRLKQLLAEKTLEVDFFKGALQKIEARRQRNSGSGENGIYDQIREVMSLQGSLSIERMCQMVPVSRRPVFTVRCRSEQPVEEEMEVRICDSADRRGAPPPLRVSTDHAPSCGGVGMLVNHKTCVADPAGR